MPAGSFSKLKGIAKQFSGVNQSDVCFLEANLERPADMATGVVVGCRLARLGNHLLHRHLAGRPVALDSHRLACRQFGNWTFWPTTLEPLCDWRLPNFVAI